MSLPPEDVTDEEFIDLRMVLAKLKARRWWVVASIAVFSALFAAAAFLIAPTYRAATVLSPAITTAGGRDSIESMLGQFGGIAALAGVNFGHEDTEKEEAMAVLNSRRFTETFFREENLLPQSFSSKWDSDLGRWRSGIWGTPTPARAFRYFDDKVRHIAEDKKTGLVRLEINWRDRTEAAQWANELVARLNAEMRARAIADADRSVKYLERELASTTIIEVREAINRLIESQVKRRMMASVNQEYAFRVVDEAVSPDADDPASPNRLLLLLAGPVIGLIVAIGLVLLADYFTSRPADSGNKKH